MDLNKLNPLPEWDDSKIRNQGDEWKSKDYHLAIKALYIHWRELFQLVQAFADSLTDKEEDSEDSYEYSNKNLIYENIMKVGPKILSIVNIDSYVIRMEVAAIVRYNCIEMMEQVGYAIMLGYEKASYEEVIQESMETFKQFFKQWVTTFEKDDYEDEWGLFV